MRKRSGRPPRYAAVPNQTIDDATNLDFMAIALLVVLLRHRDGWDITLEKIGDKYGYGRDALAKAMGLLMVARYVVKVRMMAVNGNLWSTEVYIYDTPATDPEVAALLAEVERDPAVRRAEVIQPTAAAVKHAAKRTEKLKPKGRQGPSVAVPRVLENPDSGATCENDASQQDSSECRDSRQSGDPTVFKKTVGGEDERESEALAARSAGDGRSPSDGSNVREVEGGSAASSKDQPSPTTDENQGGAPAAGSSKGKPKHTREQLAQVRAVHAYFPAQLAVPSIPVISNAILAALAGDVPGADRTVAQLGARIQDRWHSHGWAMKVLEGQEIRSAVGVALDLVRPYGRGDKWGCADVRCEAGVNIDTGEPCQVCPQRIADRRTDRRNGGAEKPPMPGQRSSGECAVDSCALPLPADSTDVLCPRCRKRADDEAERAARFQAPEPQPEPGDGWAEDPVDEEQRRREAAEAEETARLRAQFAAQYGTTEQREAYCTTAPF